MQMNTNSAVIAIAASFVFIVLNKIYEPFTLLWGAKVLLIL